MDKEARNLAIVNAVFAIAGIVIIGVVLLDGARLLEIIGLVLGTIGAVIILAKQKRAEKLAARADELGQDFDDGRFLLLMFALFTGGLPLAIVARLLGSADAAQALAGSYTIALIAAGCLIFSVKSFSEMNSGGD